MRGRLERSGDEEKSAIANSDNRENTELNVRVDELHLVRFDLFEQMTG